MLAARLSPLDAGFLAVESPTAHMHVGWAAILDPPADEAPPSFEELRSHIAARLPRAPRYRQLLRPLPLDLNTPAWVDDVDFDLDRHVLWAKSERLGEVVDECMSVPLPRDRPLWQLWIAPRLEDGRIGVIGKVHHCMVDGIAAVQLASLLLDPEPHPPVPPAEDWAPKPPPRRRRLLLDGLGDLARRQLDLFALPARLLSSPKKARETLTEGRRAALALADALRPARPVWPFNEPISPLRHLELLKRPLEDLQTIKRAFGVKLNDVLLAAGAGGVRRFLHERGGVAIALKTMVPVNVRHEDESGATGNRISFMFVDLPCEEPDPIERLYQINAATAERKRNAEPQGAEAVIASLGVAPPPFQRFVSRLLVSPQAFNLAVSNIPGPPAGLYMAGCPLVEVYPVVPIADRHALSIGVTTVGKGAFFGLYADRESLPDVDDLARDIDAEIDELLSLAREQTGQPAEEQVGGEVSPVGSRL